MMYIKSLATGQVYEVETLPKYLNGYELVTKEEFEAWKKKMGL